VIGNHEASKKDSNADILWSEGFAWGSMAEGAQNMYPLKASFTYCYDRLFSQKNHKRLETAISYFSDIP
jgi:hypothetical protein